MKHKFLTTISGATLYISFILILSKGIGFIREIVFAGYYGTGTQYDIYLVSSVIPLTLNIVVFFVGQNYFIPSLNRYSDTGEKNEIQFSKQVFLSYILLAFILIIPLFFFSEWLLKVFFSLPQKEIRDTPKLIFQILLFTVPLSAGISILTSYLQSKLEFKFPAISYLFINFSIIIIIILFSSSLGNISIALGYLIGTLLQFVYLLKKTFGIRAFIFETKYLLPDKIRSVLYPNIIYIVLIESIGQLYTIIDRIFFAELPDGGVASINYAQSLFLFPISIFTFALSTVIFPKISKAFSKKNLFEVNEILSRSSRVTVLIFTPIALIYLFYSTPLIKLIFERGKFSNEGTLLTSEALGVFAISLVFYALYSILNKVFYSANLSKLLLILTIIGICLKYLLNYQLVGYFEQAGLALSTSITYIIFLIISLYLIKLKLNIDLDKKVWLELILNVFNGIFSYIFVETFFSLFSFADIFVVKLSFYLFVYMNNNLLIDYGTIKFIKLNFFSNQLFFNLK
ncbi:MAG: polysaccharide biosynthesis C-terminal domain-containing protein [Ignavibacterium sp.]|nr:polysaccharide biosynthesis C-terminal domain-containing protein [Ignavibacterium sp.]